MGYIRKKEAKNEISTILVLSLIMLSLLFTGLLVSTEGYAKTVIPKVSAMYINTNTYLPFVLASLMVSGCLMLESAKVLLESIKNYL